MFVRNGWNSIVEITQARAKLYIYALLLWPALQWGVLAAISARVASIKPIETPLLLMMCSLSSVGTSLFGISHFIRFAYPLAMLGPLTLATATNLNPSNHLLMALLILFLFYLHGVDKRTYLDYHAAMADRKALAAQTEKLENLSTIDALTNLNNRFHFDLCLTKQWELAKLTGDKVCVFIIDVDFFKKINDTYGHPFGDKCLQAIAATLKSLKIRSNDVVARYGGEEFALMLVKADLDFIQGLAQKIIDKVQEVELSIDGQRPKMSCSIGIATANATDLIPKEFLIEAADKALYQAKRDGRACYRTNFM